MGNADSALACCCSEVPDKSLTQVTNRPTSAPVGPDKAHAMMDPHASEQMQYQPPHTSMTSATGEELDPLGAVPEPVYDHEVAPVADPMEDAVNDTYVEASHAADSDEIDVDLDRKEDKLGLAVAYFADTGVLQVKSVKDEGCAAKWNRANPSRQIEMGCHVLKLNGRPIADLSTYEIGTVLASSDRVTMTVTRGKELRTIPEDAARWQQQGNAGQVP
mmetsp:Transcript_69701/g.167322  ORF Transcript_69701/g.167322 Transcript_69701/m.167322 type:complete len:218 (-) Transcript_69701:204-857(-)